MCMTSMILPRSQIRNFTPESSLCRPRIFRNPTWRRFVVVSMGLCHLQLRTPDPPGQVLADRPEAADQYEFAVEDGDVILMATDGIFDNVPDRLLVEEMDKVQHCKDEMVLQQSANTIALMARRLSRDSQVILASPAAVWSAF